jgi:hypothetical protein
MATNYPIVRLTNTGSGAVIYCRTSNHSTMAVATGAATVSTSVTIPTGTPTGTYTLVVIANGIPSAGMTVTVTVKTKLEKIEIKEIKEIKLEKIEIKEHKELKVEKAEIKEIEKPIVETKLKDSETIQQTQQQVSDPALQAALQSLSDRVDALAAQVRQQQAPITREERPTVGEAPLLHSSSPEKKE